MPLHPEPIPAHLPCLHNASDNKEKGAKEHIYRRSVENHVLEDSCVWSTIVRCRFVVILRGDLGGGLGERLEASYRMCGE
jgi:hypothetical protein